MVSRTRYEAIQDYRGVSYNKWVFSHGLVVKNPLANVGDAGDVGSIPGWGRYRGVGNGNPPQYSCLENSMGRGAGRLQFMGLQRVG